jgi:CRISPR-associated protein Csx3
MKDKFIFFNIKQNNNFVLIEFELSREISPSDLKNVLPPDPVKNKFSAKGVVLSGRGAIWLYGYLIHFYHPTKFVAVYDPRLEAAIVVESHTEEVKVGDLISIIL